MQTAKSYRKTKLAFATNEQKSFQFPAANQVSQKRFISFELKISKIDAERRFQTHLQLDFSKRTIETGQRKLPFSKCDENTDLQGLHAIRARQE